MPLLYSNDTNTWAAHDLIIVTQNSAPVAPFASFYNNQLFDLQELTIIFDFCAKAEIAPSAHFLCHFRGCARNIWGCLHRSLHWSRPEDNVCYTCHPPDDNTPIITHAPYPLYTTRNFAPFQLCWSRRFTLHSSFPVSSHHDRLYTIKRRYAIVADYISGTPTKVPSKNVRPSQIKFSCPWDNM